MPPKTHRPAASLSNLSLFMPSRLKSSLSRIASFTLLFGALTSPAVMRSQAADAAPAPSSSVNAPVVADRLTSPIVESARVKLGGTVHPLANQANDRGAVSDGLKLERLQVVLKRSDAQEASLKQLIAGLHSAGSAGTTSRCP